MVKAIADRYDGKVHTTLNSRNRRATPNHFSNPFGEAEHGKFYSRSMSGWSILLACQGFIYDGPAGVIGFKPVWKPEGHRSMFTSAEGWGVFTQKRNGKEQSEKIELRYGQLELASLEFELPTEKQVANEPIKIKINNQSITGRLNRKGTTASIVLDQRQTIQTGQTLEVKLCY